ncbi:hypothetical protein K474DRAFT_1574435, partial [Panus rudis PR-1116 ss-1]
SLGEFLHKLFRAKDDAGTKVKRGRSHAAAVSKFLQGLSGWKPVHIVDLMYSHYDGRPPQSHSEHDCMFSPVKSPEDICFARPSLSTWALRVVISQLTKESDKLISKEAGLRVRASRRHQKYNRSTKDPTATWDIINNFSMDKLDETYKRFAPTLRHILMSFMRPPTCEKRDSKTDKYRPKHLVCTSVISELVYARNQCANLLPLCRGISMFAMKAHQSIYRVSSRFAQCTPYTTVRNALVQMAHERRESLRQRIRAVWIVLDNLQQWAKRRDQRIGNKSEMITGCGGTAVELELGKCGPNALYVDEWQKRCAEGRRRELTTDRLMDDIDWDHVQLINELHFLSTLVNFVPALQGYRDAVRKLFETEAQKHQIDPNRRSKIQPLGTNAANEVSFQGMKEAMVDFFEQVGITKDSEGVDQIQFVSGDGKSFEAMGKVKKYLTDESAGPLGRYKSFQFALETLELWHTKWTELGRICHGKWGGSYDKQDPSTLGFMAKTVNVPVSPDLKKPEFYPNTRLIEITVTAHIIRCWEVYFGTKDIVRFFEEHKSRLPTLDTLRGIAKKLQNMYATSRAYEQALHDQSVVDEPEMESTTHTEDASVSAADSQEQPPVKPKFKGDWALANSILMIRDGILYLEVCRAIETGDIGCVWEILKFWIFTFAGSSHSNYAAYLLEMYCKIKYELPEDTQLALFENWLVNLQGKPGHFHELDLMQEHFNKWLEELAQHKGKDFDNEWYRDVLSMHVHHFLHLKEKFEGTVELAPRTKRHSEPHLRNEYRAALQVLRENDLHRHHEGRDLGFHAQDDLAEGYKVLERKGKLAEFI